MVLEKFTSFKSIWPLFCKYKRLNKLCLVQPQRFYSDSEDSFYQDIPTVFTTAICCKDKSGRTIARIGTYWGKNDELNSYKPFSSGVVTIARAQLESVSFALRQAIYDKKTKGVIVKTDSKYVSNIANRFIENWRTNNFHKIDGTPVKNREDIEELDRLLQSVEADIQYVEFAKDGQNLLLKYLTDEGVITEDINELQSQSFDTESKSFSNFVSDENSKQNVPVVYVSGSFTKSGKNSFYVSGYGVHWANNEFRDQSGRFSDLPITLYRSQLTAIYLALEEAVNAGLSRVEIATDCGMFLTHFKAKWKKANGLPIANYPLYKKILNLTDKIEVKFTYIPESLNNLEMEKSKQLAIDGMAYPIMRKTRTGPFPTELLTNDV